MNAKKKVISVGRRRRGSVRRRRGSGGLVTWWRMEGETDVGEGAAEERSN